MTLDVVILALYFGALIFTKNKRDAFVALFCFSTACLVASGNFTSPYQYHLSISLIYIIGALSSADPRLRVLFFAIMIYQYGMGFDAFILPNTETILYQSYQYVAFLLNLIVIGYIGGGYGVSNSRDSFRGGWRFNFSSLAFSRSDKSRLQKGESK